MAETTRRFGSFVAGFSPQAQERSVPLPRPLQFQAGRGRLELSEAPGMIVRMPLPEGVTVSQEAEHL